jgi:hypothetical protein
MNYTQAILFVYGVDSSSIKPPDCPHVLDLDRAGLARLWLALLPTGKVPNIFMQPPVTMSFTVIVARNLVVLVGHFLYMVWAVKPVTGQRAAPLAIFRANKSSFVVPFRQ